MSDVTKLVYSGAIFLRAGGMAKYASSETALHPALERAWNEASACLARGGTFLLRTGPGYTNLLPIPAWRLRQFGAAELHALAGGATELSADAALEAAGAPTADARKGEADATAGRTPAALAARRARRTRQKANKRAAIAAAHAELAKAAVREQRWRKQRRKRRKRHMVVSALRLRLLVAPNRPFGGCSFAA